MSIMLNLPPETEKLLMNQAMKAGLTLEAYLKSLAEREAAAPTGSKPTSVTLSDEQWSAEWRAWANVNRQLPSGLEIDDSRESIYAGRGE